MWDLDINDIIMFPLIRENVREMRVKLEFRIEIVAQARTHG